MKNFFHITIILFLSSFNNYSQNVDTLKWISFNDTLTHYSFTYPSIFKQEYDSEILRLFNGVHFSFTSYPDYYGNNGTINLHLQVASSFTVLFTNKDMNEIANYFSYEILSGIWYDYEALTCSWIDTLVEKFNFNNWIGFENVTPSAIYFEEGGTLSKGVDDDRYVFIKKIEDKQFLYVFAEGFRFDEKVEVLRNICNSIIIKP